MSSIVTDNAAPAGQADAGTPNPNPNPNPAPQADAGGAAPKAWFDSFADEDKGYIQNKGWNNDDGTKNLLASYKNLEKLRGVPEDRLLKLPENLEDAEGMGKIYERLGRPEKPEGYEFKAPEGVELDASRMAWAASLAHSIGLNKAQHKALVENTLKFEGDIFKAQTEKAEQDRLQSFTKLKDEWGSAYEERKTLAERGLMRFMTDGGKEGEAVAKLQQVMGHAEVMKLFANIGGKIAEDQVPAGDGVRPFGYSPEQAKADKASLINELNADKTRLAAYNSGKGPDYEKMQRLIKIAAGGAA
jgi:hypothetical protein